MKKKLLAISIIASIASVLNASEFDTKISIGASSAKIGTDSYTQFGVGYSSNKLLNSGIILGFGNSLSYGNVRDGVNATTADMDLRVGYEVMKNLTAFALGTGVYQYIDNSSATGLGYGASLEYKISNTVSLAGSYKTTKMTYSTKNYDYDTSNFAVKFNF